MKSRPIPMHGRSINGLNAGRKVQTRRICREQDGLDIMAGRPDGTPGNSDDIALRWGQVADDDGKLSAEQWIVQNAEYPDEGGIPLGQGYGRPGDLLWVREPWETLALFDELPPREIDHRARIVYLADGMRASGRYRHTRFMCRWMSRLTLYLTDVRVERVQEISDADALAEGIEYRHGFYMGGIHPVKSTHKCMPTAREAFRGLWDDTNGTDAWERNDWCWALSFEVIHTNVDDVIADPAHYGLAIAGATA